VKRAAKTARKLAVALIGFPLLIVGIVLIPLPGPGVLISLVAFFILSLEFDWAETYLEKAKFEIKKIIRQAQERADKISKEK